MSKKIRVLRIMEYVYDDAERMISDMAAWGVPVQLDVRDLTIRSTTLSPEILDDDDTEADS